MPHHPRHTMVFDYPTTLLLARDFSNGRRSIRTVLPTMELNNQFLSGLLQAMSTHLQLRAAGASSADRQLRAAAVAHGISAYNQHAEFLSVKTTTDRKVWMKYKEGMRRDYETTVARARSMSDADLGTVEANNRFLEDLVLAMAVHRKWPGGRTDQARLEGIVAVARGMRAYNRRAEVLAEKDGFEKSAQVQHGPCSNNEGNARFNYDKPIELVNYISLGKTLIEKYGYKELNRFFGKSN